MQQLTLGLAVYAAAIAWTSCVVWYSIRAKWWKNIYGINTWVVSFTIAVALNRLAILLLFPHFLGASSYWIGLFTYIALTISGLQRLYLLEKAQREGEDGDTTPKTIYEKQFEHPPVT